MRLKALGDILASVEKVRKHDGKMSKSFSKNLLFDRMWIHVFGNAEICDPLDTFSSVFSEFFIGYVQCCGSGMFIPDPDFFPSLIPDPKKHGEVKKNFVAFRSC